VDTSGWKISVGYHVGTQGLQGCPIYVPIAKVPLVGSPLKGPLGSPFEGPPRGLLGGPLEIQPKCPPIGPIKAFLECSLGGLLKGPPRCPFGGLLLGPPPPPLGGALYPCHGLVAWIEA